MFKNPLSSSSVSCQAVPPSLPPHQHVPVDGHRLVHLRRTVTVLAIMEASWKPCDGMSPHVREHRLSLLARVLTEPRRAARPRPDQSTTLGMNLPPLDEAHRRDTLLAEASCRMSRRGLSVRGRARKAVFQI